MIYLKKTNPCHIEYDAFSKCERLESITIKNPECKIYDSKYTICNDNTVNGYFKGTIYGYPGSTAQAYADNCGYKNLFS